MAGTIQEIAIQAGVSRGTVDRVLNQRGKVKPEVAERIEKIADQMGYIPKHRRKGMRIGVVTQLADASFMIPINQGIRDAEAYLKERGTVLLKRECKSVDEKEQKKAIESLLEEEIDGLAIMPVESESIRTLLNDLVERLGILVVTFNSDIVGTKRSCFIGLDNRQSGRAAAGLMGMMTQGEGKVLVITGYFSNSASSRRVDGFVEEMKNQYPDMELVGVQSSLEREEEVERIIVQMLTVYPDLKGIFVVSGGQTGVKRAFDCLEPAKRPYVIIYDMTPQNKTALLEGTVDFLIDQEGYEQGYQAPVRLANLLEKRETLEREYVYTEIKIKTKYNVEE